MLPARCAPRSGCGAASPGCTTCSTCSACADRKQGEGREMRGLAWGAVAAAVSGSAWAQAHAGTVEVTADDCKMYVAQAEARGASRVRWSGACVDGRADGPG